MIGILERNPAQPYDPSVTIEPLPVGDPAAEVWRLLTVVLQQRKEEFPALAQSFGLNPGAMHALLQLDPDEPQSMSSLAGAWKCDASNVTWLVDRLEERGLAERRAHPHDRRIRTVAVTRKGAKVRQEIQARFYEPPDVLRALPARDLQTLAKILHKIVPDAPDRH